MADKRPQLNIRVDDELLAAIDDIRASKRPIPSVTGVIRAAVLDAAVKARKKTKAE